MRTAGVLVTGLVLVTGTLVVIIGRTVSVLGTVTGLGMTAPMTIDVEGGSGLEAMTGIGQTPPTAPTLCMMVVGGEMGGTTR